MRGDRRAVIERQTLGGNYVQRESNPIQAKQPPDWSKFDHQQQSEAATHRVLLLSGMATVSVVLLTIAGYLHLNSPSESVQSVAQAAAAPAFESAIASIRPPATRPTFDEWQSDPAYDEQVTMPEEAPIEVVARAPTPEETFVAPPVIEPRTEPEGLSFYTLNARSPCVAALQQVARETTLYFELGSVVLDMAQLEQARKIGQKLQDCPEAALQLWGHADGTGDEIDNYRLSSERARNIMAAFSAMGFDTARVEAVALGDSRPNLQGAQDGSYDRRVEFRVIPRPD